MISKEKVKVYEAIRQSGATNMFDVKMVVSLSMGELTRADCLDIMKNYDTYIKKYKISRGE